LLVRELTESTPNEPDGDAETDENVQFHDVSVVDNGTFYGSEMSFLGTFLDTIDGQLHRVTVRASCRWFAGTLIKNTLALVVVTKLYWVWVSA
jgi:hypothetical protein